MSMEAAERSKLVAANIRPVTKDALLEEAKRQGTSVSALVSDWIEEKLTVAGHVLTQPATEAPSEPLPFEPVQEPAKP